MLTTLRRTAVVAAATAAVVAGSAGAALAQDCIIGTHSTNAPASSNWATFTALDAAEQFAGFTPGCDAQVAAGYAALKAAHLPSSLKVRTDKEIGEHSSSPRLADGHGLDHFDAGSPYPDLMVGTFLGGALSTAC